MIDTYNAELRDPQGFVGDRASKRAFAEILEDWRERLRAVDADPLGDTPTEDIPKKKLDRALEGDDPESAGLVHGVIEDFANELASVIRRFLRLKAWAGTERIVVGGGLKESRVGLIAIGRAAVLLKGNGVTVDLQPIRGHPDEAGLVGAIHLVPHWVFSGHDGILAVDIGGTNIRAGVVQLPRKHPEELGEAKVWRSVLWRHRDDKPTREQAIARLGEMLRGLVEDAKKEKLGLAPFVGVGCPGLIAADGAIRRGGQNLPGNWESRRFSLPQAIRGELPEIGGHETVVLLHNDAVVQGLSEVPFQRDVERWGVMTIGTGLGNARFSNRRPEG